MRIDVLTLFPEMFTGVLGSSILRRAANRGLGAGAGPGAGADGRSAVVSYHLHDIRGWSGDARHQKVDASPYGGGPGMVMQCQPIWDAVRAVEAMDDRSPTRVLLTPKGRPLTQKLAEALALTPRLLLIAGHYEGLDQRVIDRLHDSPPAAEVPSPNDKRDDHLLEISVGDYVLSGGELPAMTLIDAVVRLLPGALGHAESATQDSFSPGSDRLLDHPHYTRPPTWADREVPGVLIGGDHAKVAAWRREAALATTRRVRPDLLAPAPGAHEGRGDAFTVVLREAARGDLPAIESLHRAAFGGDTEARIVRTLTDDQDDAISLVAEAAGRVVGHVVLSPVTLVDEPGIRGLLALGPLAIEPAVQRRGLGSALVREALRRCHDARVQRLFVRGHPAFFTRFGFTPAAELGFTNDHDLRVLTVRDTRPVTPGVVRHSTAFAE